MALGTAGDACDELGAVAGTGPISSTFMPGISPAKARNGTGLSAARSASLRSDAAMSAAWSGAVCADMRGIPWQLMLTARAWRRRAAGQLGNASKCSAWERVNYVVRCASTNRGNALSTISSDAVRLMRRYLAAFINAPGITKTSRSASALQCRSGSPSGHSLQR